MKNFKLLSRMGVSGFTALSFLLGLFLNGPVQASTIKPKPLRRVNPSCYYWLGHSNLHMNAENQNLDKTIAALGSGNTQTSGHKSVLGLVNMVEAGTPENLARLFDEVPLKKNGMNTQIRASSLSADETGPGLASIFSTLSGVTNHFYFAPKDLADNTGSHLWQDVEARPILEVTLQLPNGQPMHTFVNQWPGGQDEYATARRIQAARFEWNLWKDILHDNPRANIFATHDGNTDGYGTELLSEMPLERPPQDLKKIDNSKMYLLNYDAADYSDHSYARDFIVVSGHMLRYYVKGSFEAQPSLRGAFDFTLHTDVDDINEPGKNFY